MEDSISHREQEPSSVVDRNLQILENKMQRVLGDESTGAYGSNTRARINGEPYSVLGVNFVANKDTGQIEWMDLPQLGMNEALQSNPDNIKVLYQVAVNMPQMIKGTEKELMRHIVGIHVKPGDELSQEASDVLDQTGEAWNEKYGKKS